MKAIGIVLLALAMCGCATSREVYTANGAMVYVIDCYGKTAAACTEKAGEMCGSLGYRFVKADGTPLPPPAPAPAPTPAPAAEPATAPAPAAQPADDSGGIFSNLKTIKLDRKMYIQCSV